MVETQPQGLFGAGVVPSKHATGRPAVNRRGRRSLRGFTFPGVFSWREGEDVV